MNKIFWENILMLNKHEKLIVFPDTVSPGLDIWIKSFQFFVRNSVWVEWFKHGR